MFITGIDGGGTNTRIEIRDMGKRICPPGRIRPAQAQFHRRNCLPATAAAGLGDPAKTGSGKGYNHSC